MSHHISCIPSYAGHPSLLHSLLYLFIFLGGHIPGHPLLAFLADVCRSPWPTDCNSHCGLTAVMCFVAASHQCGPSPQLPPPISYMLPCSPPFRASCRPPLCVNHTFSPIYSSSGSLVLLMHPEQPGSSAVPSAPGLVSSDIAWCLGLVG